MSTVSYRVGIDLGTSNCTLSFAQDDGRPQTFAFCQHEDAQRTQESALLPAQIYFPTSGE